MASSPNQVRGDDLIYPFLRDLFADDQGVFGAVPRALLAATAIWLPLHAYAVLPIMAPYVVRDPTCRPHGTNPDMWASPDANGFVRDDNSLIKGIPRSLAVVAPRQKHLHGRRMSTEFVAAHVWRLTADGGPLASRRPLLNSFIPNVVWLPSQIAKLTDLEGSLVQRTLQEMAWARYRHAEVEPHLEDVVEEAWALLPEPSAAATFRFDEWNYFDAHEKFLKSRQAKIIDVATASSELASGATLNRKVISSRYTAGLSSVDPTALLSLAAFLDRLVRPPDSGPAA